MSNAYVEIFVKKDFTQSDNEITVCSIIILMRFSAICASSCQNGGTCTAPNTCTCTSSWTGGMCTTRKSNE